TQSAQRFAKHSLSELEKEVYAYILKQTINVQHSIRLRKATARQDAQHSTLNCSRFALRTAELQSLIRAFRAAREVGSTRLSSVAPNCACISRRSLAISRLPLFDELLK